MTVSIETACVVPARGPQFFKHGLRCQRKSTWTARFFKILLDHVFVLESWQWQGRNEEGQRGHNYPGTEWLCGRQITAGRGGRRKVPTMSKYFLQCSTFTSENLRFEHGAPNLFLAPGGIWPRYAPEQWLLISISGLIASIATSKSREGLGFEAIFCFSCKRFVLLQWKDIAVSTVTATCLLKIKVNS